MNFRITDIDGYVSWDSTIRYFRLRRERLLGFKEYGKNNFRNSF